MKNCSTNRFYVGFIENNIAFWQSFNKLEPVY